MAEDTSRVPDIDVRDVINKSTSKVSIKELERQGFRKVKVLKQGDINDLIHQAVNAAFSRREEADAQDREAIAAESRAELKKLMKSQQAGQTKQGELEQEIARLKAHAGELEAERGDFARRVEKNLASKKEVISGYEDQIKDLERQLTQRQQTEKQLKAKLERMEEESRRLQEALSEKDAQLAAGASGRPQGGDTWLDQEPEGLAAGQMLSLRRERETLAAETEKLRARVKDLEAGGGGDLGRLEKMMAALTSKLDNQPGGAASPEMMQTLLDAIRRGGARGDDKTPSSEVVLDGLFKYDTAGPVDSNLQQSVKTKQAGGLKDQLKKLKTLKGGGS